MLTVGVNLGSRNHRLVCLGTRAQMNITGDEILVTNFNTNFEVVRQSLADIQLASNTVAEDAW